jgi:hypothetical protein
MSTEIAEKMPHPAATKSQAIAAPPKNNPLGARHLVLAAGGAIVMLAWYVHEFEPYTSATDFAYWLGVAGASLMAALLLYPLRKRQRWTQVFGPVRHWFRFHMLAGIAGPLLILFHSTFRVGSFNAAIALSSMLLVAASGVVGRYLYRRIHQSLYGRETTLKELQATLAKHLDELDPRIANLPEVRAQIDAYLEHANRPGGGRLGRLLHFTGLGWHRKAVNRRIRSMIPPQRRTRALIADTLLAAQQAAQFNTYVRLFALWHVVHIPFLGMLLLTAIAHIVAVHTY